MIAPSAVHAAAKRMENENLKFRAFLKNHADAGELDRQFLKLHHELFSGYDCCKCNNCCRAYRTVLTEDEIDSIAALIGVARQEFVKQHLVQGSGGYELKAPCPFLEADGKCRIQERKPAECKGFPYTDQPERMESLLGVIAFAEKCPVVFEIIERLKVIYRFRQ